MTDAIVPIGHKPIVFRSAIASGILDLSSDSADAIRNGLVAKGDVLEASMVAAAQTPRHHSGLEMRNAAHLVIPSRL